MVGDLTAFLAARLDEDEAAVRERWGSLDGRDGREVEAKRAILASLKSARDRFSAIDDAGLEIAVEHLAAVYSDHPDYRQEWKP